MTVRVNKPSFNIREKLSELGRKFGLKGSELAAAETVQEAREIVSAGRKNLIINGDMRIAQRNTNAVSANAQFPVDRWEFSNTDGAGVQVQQSTDVPAGEGFINSIKWSVNSTSNTTGSQAIRQHIEIQNASALGWGTSKGKSATLSFWVKGSHNGTITSSVREGAAASRSFINLTEVTTSWIKHSFTIPHISDGSWNTDPKSRGISVIFAFDRHSSANGSTENTWISANWLNHSNQTEWITVSGAEIYITGVQLEVGRNATDFEHRSFGEELALCQRYFCKSYKPEQSPGAGTSDGIQLIRNYDPNNSRSDHPAGVQFPVTMRDIPTITFYSQNGTANRYTVGNTTCGSYVNQGGTISNILLKGTGSIGGISFSTTVPAAAFAYFHYTAESEL